MIDVYINKCKSRAPFAFIMSLLSYLFFSGWANRDTTSLSRSHPSSPSQQYLRVKDHSDSGMPSYLALLIGVAIDF